MASSISFSGLATGLDTASIIDSLVSLERIPVQRLEAQKRDLSGQSSKFGTLKSRLRSLGSAIEALDSREELIASKVSSSDEGVFRATVRGEPTLGATDITVTALAQAERTYSDGVAARDGAGLFGTGTLGIQVGTGTVVDITVDATDTLESVASKINDSDAAVTADVIFDGTDYRLRVAGDETGAANALTFTESGTTLGLTLPENERQAATDAAFTVDGLAMTRPTNTVTDAIPGVTLDLRGRTGGAAASLRVERDPSAVRANLQAFVDAYNQVQSFINVEFAYFGAPKGGDSLSGDATLRSLQSRLRGIASSSPSGLTGSYRTFADLGVEGSQTGELSLDAAKLEEALTDDPDSVMTLLNGDEAAGVTGLFASLTAAIEEYADDGDGVLTSRINALTGRQEDIDDQIDRLERRIVETEERLVKQFATLEQTVSGLQNQGNQLLAMLSQGS